MIPINSTLSEIREELQCPFANLHTAGNDAYFTLQALLMLAKRTYRSGFANNNEHQDKLIGNHTSLYTKPVEYSGKE